MSLVDEETDLGNQRIGHRELEAEGVVEKRRTAGTYISSAGPRLSRRERMKILSARIDALLAEARQLDIAVAEVVELIRRRDEAMEARKGAEES